MSTTSGKMRVKAALHMWITFKKDGNIQRIRTDELEGIFEDWDWKAIKAAIEFAVQELFKKRINLEDELDCIRMFCEPEIIEDLFSDMDDECFTVDEF